MARKTQGEWPYHKDKHGKMVPCQSNPCRRHSGGDIMASSPEEAYLKSESQVSEGLSSKTEETSGNDARPAQNPEQVGNARLRPFKEDPSHLPSGAYYRLSDGRVYHVRQVGTFNNVFTEVDPVTGMEDEDRMILDNRIDFGHGVTVEPIQPIKPKGMDGRLIAKRDQDSKGRTIISVTSEDGSKATLYPIDGDNPDIKNTLREYGFRYDGSDEDERGGWNDPMECRCHHINGLVEETASGDGGGTQRVVKETKAERRSRLDKAVSSFIKPPGTVEDPYGPSPFKGGRYDETRGKSSSEIAKMIRGDVKNLKKVGAIPSGWKISVRKETGAWMDGFNVTIKPEGDVKSYRSVQPDDILNDPEDGATSAARDAFFDEIGGKSYTRKDVQSFCDSHPDIHVPTQETLDTMHYLREATSQYEFSDDDLMTDYHNTRQASYISLDGPR